MFSKHAGSVHHSPEGLVLMGSVDGRPCNVTVNTGSNISIVQPDILTEETRNSLQSSNQMLRTVTGDMAPIRGRGELKMGVGELVVPLGMWVAEITDECILGLDFLEKHGCQVDLRENVWCWMEKRWPLTSLFVKLLWYAVEW